MPPVENSAEKAKLTRLRMLLRGVVGGVDPQMRAG